jgi:tRNA A37 threonylcarbamoyladenosine biosynthesis protein TsaE
MSGFPTTRYFQLVPDTSHERDILYITGASGSGKSTFTRQYIEQYKKNTKIGKSTYSVISRKTPA